MTEVYRNGQLVGWSSFVRRHDGRIVKVFIPV